MITTILGVVGGVLSAAGRLRGPVARWFVEPSTTRGAFGAAAAGLPLLLILRAHPAATVATAGLAAAVAYFGRELIDGLGFRFLEPKL